VAKEKINELQVGGTHYKNGDCKQHWDFTWENKYDQFQYCITKYVHRHKGKDGLEDLYKARHHLNKYIELLEDATLPKREGAGYVKQ
jgi:hypothetical protein